MEGTLDLLGTSSALWQYGPGPTWCHGWRRTSVNGGSAGYQPSSDLQGVYHRGWASSFDWTLTTTIWSCRCASLFHIHLSPSFCIMALLFRSAFLLPQSMHLLKLPGWCSLSECPSCPWLIDAISCSHTRTCPTSHSTVPYLRVFRSCFSVWWIGLLRSNCMQGFVTVRGSVLVCTYLCVCMCVFVRVCWGGGEGACLLACAHALKRATVCKRLAGKLSVSLNRQEWGRGGAL